MSPKVGEKKKPRTTTNNAHFLWYGVCRRLRWLQARCRRLPRGLARLGEPEEEVTLREAWAKGGVKGLPDFLFMPYLVAVISTRGAGGLMGARRGAFLQRLDCRPWCSRYATRFLRRLFPVLCFLRCLSFVAMFCLFATNV